MINTLLIPVWVFKCSKVGRRSYSRSRKVSLASIPNEYHQFISINESVSCDHYISRGGCWTHSGSYEK